MKTKMIFLAFCMTIMFCMSACAGTTKNTSSDLGAVTEISASENNETESPEENVMSEGTAMSACCLFSGVFECVIFTMDKEMRKTKSTSLPSPFLSQKNKGILNVSS